MNQGMISRVRYRKKNLEKSQKKILENSRKEFLKEPWKELLEESRKEPTGDIPLKEFHGQFLKFSQWELSNESWIYS